MDPVCSRVLKEVDLNSCSSMTGLPLTLYYVCLNSAATFKSKTSVLNETSALKLIFHHTCCFFPFFTLSLKTYEFFVLCFTSFASHFKVSKPKWAVFVVTWFWKNVCFNKIHYVNKKTQQQASVEPAVTVQSDSMKTLKNTVHLSLNWPNHQLAKVVLNSPGLLGNVSNMARWTIHCQSCTYKLGARKLEEKVGNDC